MSEKKLNNNESALDKKISTEVIKKFSSPNENKSILLPAKKSSQNYQGNTLIKR